MALKVWDSEANPISSKLKQHKQLIPKAILLETNTYVTTLQMKSFAGSIVNINGNQHPWHNTECIRPARKGYGFDARP